MEDPRVVKAKLPVRTLVTAVAIGVLVLAFIVYAVWQSGIAIIDAKKTGIITEKEFVPAPENQITLNRDGAVTARHSDGDYILTVEVTQPDGKKKSYYVWVNKTRFDAVKVGDSYDVGPALVRD